MGSDALEMAQAAPKAAALMKCWVGAAGGVLEREARLPAVGHPYHRELRRNVRRKGPGVGR